MCYGFCVMKTWHNILIFVGCLAVSFENAKAADISGNITISGDYMINQDITVMDGASIEAHDMVMTDCVKIINRGSIGGGINVCENCTVEIRNQGAFNAEITLQNNSHFVQVISANDDITNLGIMSGFGVSVRDGVGLNFANIMSVATNANTVDFSNVDFDAGTIDGFVAPTNITLTGDIILRFDDIVNQPKLLFSNVSGKGKVYADSDELDKVHTLQIYRVNNDVFLRLARSTDYARILNNDMGHFLGNLRSLGYDDKLFSKLDSVETMDEINDILLHSVRTNPIKLMRPISLVNSYKGLEFMHIDDGIVFGVEPIMIYSSDVFVRGVRPNVSFKTDDLYLKLSGYFMDMNYSDDINDYGGTAIGIDIDAQYDMDDNEFARLHFGGGKSFFDIGPVFANGSVINNPDGEFVYAIGEYGWTFDVLNDYKLSPFIGGGAEYIAVANVYDTNIFGVAGMDIVYEYKFDGLRYNYSLRGFGRTDGTLGAGLNLSIWSIMDAAGADVHIGTIYNDDFGMSFKISLNGKFVF